jgi:hypothetical protein
MAIMPSHEAANNPSSGADTDKNIGVRLRAGKTKILRQIIVRRFQPAGTP